MLWSRDTDGASSLLYGRYVGNDIELIWGEACPCRGVLQACVRSRRPGECENPFEGVVGLQSFAANASEYIFGMNAKEDDGDLINRHQGGGN
jgi:hypothetical protein